MGNFKIKVNTPEESNEVQYLFEVIGYERGACSLGDYPAVIVTTQDWATGNYCSTRALGLNNPAHESYKEITLPELRAMVVLKRNDVNDATHESSILKYFKACDDWYYFDLGCTDKWQKSAGAKPEYYEKLKPIEKNMNTLNTEHHEQPSLNDQYAEIEQMRQAIKAASGNDSDHAVDAMSYAFMGVGIEQVRQHRHYFIDVSDVDEIDFYEIALRYNVTDPCVQHILKKCLAVGRRGQKDFHHDLKDIYDTAKRMLDVHGLDS